MLSLSSHQLVLMVLVVLGFIALQIWMLCRFGRSSEKDIIAAIKESHKKRIQAIASWEPKKGNPTERFNEYVKVFNRRVARFATLTDQLLKLHGDDAASAKFKERHHYLLRVAILERNDKRLEFYKHLSEEYEKYIVFTTVNKVISEKIIKEDPAKAEWEANKALVKKVLTFPKTALLASIKAARQSLHDLELATRPE